MYAGRMLLVAFLSAAAVLPAVHGLSWPLCENGGSVWVTKQPSTDPQYPGADLWFSCDSGLNVLGDSLDTCINQGSVCTPAVNTAICKFLGYDEVWGDVAAVPASAGEPVRSLTGEYCLRRGVYSRTIPEDLASMPGEPCLKIQRISCIRSLQRMSDSLEPIIMEAVMDSAATQPDGAAAQAAEASVVEPEVSAAAGPNGGRKLRL